jgi:hypothetical protein
MVADLERAAHLALAVLSGPEDLRPDALFDLLILIENVDANAIADVIEAAQENIYSLTAHCKQAFQARRGA